MAANPVPGSVSSSHSSTVLPPPVAPLPGWPPTLLGPPPPAAAAAAAAPPGASSVRVASSFSSVAYSCVSSRSSRSRMISSFAEAESSVLLGPAAGPGGRRGRPAGGMGQDAGPAAWRCCAAAARLVPSHSAASAEAQVCSLALPKAAPAGRRGRPALQRGPHRRAPAGCPMRWSGGCACAVPGRPGRAPARAASADLQWRAGSSRRGM